MLKFLFLLLFFAGNLFSVYFVRAKNCPIESPFHGHDLYYCNLDNGWVCNNPFGCRRNITKEHQYYNIPRFRCSACDFDLCDLCAKITTFSYTHSWHPHPLKRHYEDNGWICDGTSHKGGCRAYVVGFNQTGKMQRYRCGICDYDLCETCMKEGIKNFQDRDDLNNTMVYIPTGEGVNYEEHVTDKLMKLFAETEPMPLNDFNEEPKKTEDKKPENKMDDGSICSICYERPRNVALVHEEAKTAHIVCCEGCAKKLKDCPTCRQPIDRIVKPVYVKDTSWQKKE
jgi:hypothetical protein